MVNQYAMSMMVILYLDMATSMVIHNVDQLSG